MAKNGIKNGMRGEVQFFIQNFTLWFLMEVLLNSIFLRFSFCVGSLMPSVSSTFSDKYYLCHIPNLNQFMPFYIPLYYNIYFCVNSLPQWSSLEGSSYHTVTHVVYRHYIDTMIRIYLETMQDTNQNSQYQTQRSIYIVSPAPDRLLVCRKH